MCSVTFRSCSVTFRRCSVKPSNVSVTFRRSVKFGKRCYTVIYFGKGVRCGQKKLSFLSNGQVSGPYQFLSEDHLSQAVWTLRDIFWMGAASIFTPFPNNFSPFLNFTLLRKVTETLLGFTEHLWYVREHIRNVTDHEKIKFCCGMLRKIAE